MGYPASILAAKPIERAMGPEKNFSRALRRVALEVLPPGYPVIPVCCLAGCHPIPQTLDNCLIDVKNTITIKLEIRSLCALSPV